jgi:hypothetical protein
LRALAAPIVGVLLVGGLTTVGHAQSKPGASLKEILITGSPWEVTFYNSGARGRFNQTFVENADGSVTAKSDEVGPYETLVQFAEDGKSAIWKSPHARVIKLELDGKKPYGEGGGVQLFFNSRKR